MMNKIKVVTLAAAVTAVFCLGSLIPASGSAASEDQFDAAAAYKAKCVACHGAKSEKKFDATKADAVQVETILKGKKMEKPPNMPAYEEKGITEDQAKALVAYMKSIQQ
jgi:mono/diheme cytochrome c family protein